MKIIYFGLLAFTLVLTLCACGTSENPVVFAPEKPSTASSNAATTEKPTESESVARVDLTGPWHLDGEKNDLTALQDTFPAYMEFGARMEITSNGQISWCIGIEGGSGTYTQDGDTLTAEMVSDIDQQQMTVPFRVISDGEAVQLEMAYKGNTVYWIPGEPAGNP